MGQIYLHDLVVAYPKQSISCFAVVERGMGADTPDLEWLPIAYASRPREGGIGRFGAAFRSLSGFLLWEYTRLVRLRRIASRAVAFGEKNHVGMVWAVLSSPALIYLARRVAAGLNVPLVTTIWDPPEFITGNLGFTPLAHLRLMEEFGRVLRMSARCGVASEGMAEEYRRQYGIVPVVHIKGVPLALRKPPATGLSSPNRFTIGFAGSMYAENEWRSLLAALATAEWRLDGRDVRLRVLATRIPFNVDHSAPIEYLGWKSASETIDLMSQVDALYLPYWFDESHRTTVRLCFPGKLATYLAAGRPVFFHGPAESSPARFLGRYPVGICCHSNSEAEIIRQLRRFVNEPGLYARAAAASARAMDEELDQRVFRRRFAALIGITEDALAAT